jgi:hypothetical protein
MPIFQIRLPHGRFRRSGFRGAPTRVVAVGVARSRVARVVVEREAVVGYLRSPVVTGDRPEFAWGRA